jgi:hypothetical protein
MYKTEKTIPTVEIHGYDDKSDRFAVIIGNKKCWVSWVYLTSFMHKDDIRGLNTAEIKFMY